MKNLSSYYGLTDTRMNASEKDLPVLKDMLKINLCHKLLFLHQLTRKRILRGLPEMGQKLPQNLKHYDHYYISNDYYQFIFAMQHG